MTTSRNCCGSPEHTLNRRLFLKSGVAGALGLSLGGLEIPGPSLWADELHKQQKHVLLLWLAGGASQLETWDPKPGRPTGGPFRAIPTSVPGTHICELLPHTSRVMHNVTVVRSVTHKYPIHGVAYATTSVPEIDVAMELSPHDGRHWPFIGSVVSYLERRKNPASVRKPVPDNVALPWPFSSQRTGEVQRAGPYPAFLVGWSGSKYRQDGSSKWVPFGTGYDKLKAFRRQLENFISSIKGREMPIISAEDALASVEVVETAYDSAGRNNWVRVGAGA